MMKLKAWNLLARPLSRLMILAVCGVAQAQALFPSSTTRVIAGQNLDIGSLTCGYIAGSQSDGRCNIQLDGGWCLSLAHLYVGNQLPTSMSPGLFPFSSRPTGCVANWSIPFKLAASNTCQLKDTVVALHAEVSKAGSSPQETAWGKGDPTGSNWSMVFRLPPCSPPPT